ncbi:MAG: hypothetical protein HYV42_00345 [Candidatus Magasanikbacteria bacterium]|nr:hypothetical protein [Candidatus Magasanikbacteria bacterium]
MGFLFRGIVISVLAVSFFSISYPAQALTISPARHKLAAAPGTSHILIVQVTNPEAQERSFSLSVWGAIQDETGRPVFGMGMDRAEEWLTPEAPVITIASRRTRAVKFLVQIPADAEPGSPHYLGLMVAPAAAPGATIGLAVQAVSLLELQITGIVREAVTIKQWNSAALSLAGGQWPFTLVLENAGTVSVPITGQVLFKSWSGRLLKEAPLSLGNRLLAGATRSLTPTFAAGDFIRLPGWYQVEARVRYGVTGQEARAATSVWYLPAAIVTPVVIIILGLIAFAVRFLIKLRRRPLV